MKFSELLDHQICFSVPKRLTPVTAWQEHIPFAMFLVDVLRPRTIVELGTHAGDSFCAFCQAVSELGLQTRCYGIDTWQGDEHAGYYDSTVLSDLRAHHDPLYGTFSTLVQSTFDDALVYFDDQSIDLLHIDGYHTYERVRHDFESWSPKLSDNGVVLFHDINVRERGFGIWRFWNEIRSTYPHFEFAHGYGLGVLATGEAAAKKLDLLFKATVQSAKPIRNFFFSLGNRLTLLRSTEVKERLLRDKDAQLSEIQAKLQNSEAEIVALNAPEEEPQTEAADAGNTLQLFWLSGDSYSEGNSVKENLFTNGGVHAYYFQVPSHIRSLRIDPGNQLALVDIKSIELFANDPRESLEEKSAHVWSRRDGFDGLNIGPGILRLRSRPDFAFICTDRDPQLFLKGIPEGHQGGWFLKLIVSVTRAPENLVNTVTDEILSLEEEFRQFVATKTADLEAQLIDRDSKLKQMEREIAEAVEESSRMTKQFSERLSDKEKVISALESAAVQSKTLTEHQLQEQAALLEERERLLEQKQREVEALDRRLSETEAELRTTSATIAARERELGDLRVELLKQKGLSAERDRLQAQLSETYTYVHNITNTKGWKALSRYRDVRDRSLETLKSMVPRTFKPSLKPVQHVRATADPNTWETTGIDPQFELIGPWPRGWTKIVFEAEADSPVLRNPRLYVNRGSGYSEADSFDLGDLGQEQVIYVELGPGVAQLRLDPFEGNSRFRIKKLILKSISKREAGKNLGTNGHKPVEQRPEATAPLPARQEFILPRSMEDYEAWLEVNKWNARRERLLRAKLDKLPTSPFLSVVMPIFNAPLELLDKAIQSVVNQVYQNWELCIADDASTDPGVRSRLQEWPARDPRIRVTYREGNGNISQSTNTAAEMARGDFLVLMDQDDEITPDALGEIAHSISTNPQTDILYSDDDKIDLDGRRFAPQFKPDWSPELLLSYMYFSHLFVLRRELFFEVGGMRVGFEGSQDYDLALRASERSQKVVHIPKVLYHWRVAPGSTAVAGDSKPNSFVAGEKAVQESLDRRNVQARVFQPDWAISARCGIFSHEFDDDGPSVAILIPTKNNLQTLKACLDSLKQTAYRNYQIVIIDNESDDPDTCEFLERSEHRVLRIPSPGGKFSFAAINNRAAEQVEADYLLFLNDDTEVLNEIWLSQMVGYLGIHGVGAVGARLIFPDQRIQHAGVVHGYYNGMAGPAFKLTPAWDNGYLSYATVTRNYSAVTAACMLTKRDLFLEFGGFDEKQFAVAYNDVDYCYRLHAAGYRMVYCPTAELIHHEGHSRGRIDNPAEPAAFRKKYRRYVDPYYSPNLSLLNEQFRIDARTLAAEDIPPIKTLMCAFGFNLEGAPYSQFELTVRLRDKGVIDPIVYCPTDGPLRKEYDAKGIRVEVTQHPLSGVFELGAYENAIDSFAARLKDWGVELVYGNTLQTFYAIAAASRCDLPSIWNPRESEPWQTYFDYLGAEISGRALECFEYAYKVVFVCNATRQAWRALESHHNFTTIHNGPDKDSFREKLAKWPTAIARQKLSVSTGDIVLLSLGTVCERKGQIDLIQALARLSEKEISGIRCFIVGDRENDYSRRLHAMYSELPPSHQERITIVPETSDVALYYSAANVFVCTARIESYPRVIMEAMCAGLPIITTPVFGIAEQVQDSVNALVYEPSDTAALADAIVRLASNSTLRTELGDNSEHVLNSLTDYDEMVSLYAKVFREAWLSGESRKCVA